MLISYLVVVPASLEHCSGITWVTTCNPIALYQRLHYAIIIRWSLHYCTNTVHTIHTYITHICRHILNILLCWLAITSSRGFPSIIERFQLQPIPVSQPLFITSDASIQYTHTRMNVEYVHCMDICIYTYVYTCTFFVYIPSLGEDTQGMDPLYGTLRVKLKVFNKRIHFLCFLPRGDINNMHPIG